MKRCGISELENLGLKDTETVAGIPNTPSTPSAAIASQYWQACIFKVGDDVRQVRYGICMAALVCFEYNLQHHYIYIILAVAHLLKQMD